jgi:octaprenyl-diphosphate synthase
MRTSERTIPDVVGDVYETIRREFVSDNPQVSGILGRVFSTPGKGARPLFMEMIARRNGGGWESVRKAATAVEAVHIASLLHDDVVDGSKMRRGKATLHTRYSDKISILFGDYVFMKAIMIADSIGNPDAVQVIHDAVRRMIEGEIRDSLSIGPLESGSPDYRHPKLCNAQLGDPSKQNPGCLEDAYYSIIGDKTASLFAAAGEAGIILSGGGPRERSLARDLGEAVGMAFQIIDDTLDFQGDAALMGKPTFMDLCGGFPTLPVIHALHGYDSDEVKRMLVGDTGSADSLLAVVREHGGIEYARERARGFIQKGREILEYFGDGDSDDEFGRFFEMIVGRRA